MAAYCYSKIITVLLTVRASSYFIITVNSIHCIVILIFILVPP